MINDENDASYASSGMSKCRSGLYREEFFFFLFYSFLAKVIQFGWRKFRDGRI